MKGELIKKKKKRYEKPQLKKISIKIKESIYNSSGGGSCCGCCTCFLGGTKIITNNGHKPIEKIAPQDLVLSYNLGTQQIEYKPVLKTYRFENKEILEIVLDTGKAIKVSSTHPFYTLLGKIKAGELKIGDKLFTPNGCYPQIVKIRKFTYAHPVITYNLTVKDNHNFFIEDDLILVGNKDIEEP